MCSHPSASRVAFCQDFADGVLRVVGVDAQLHAVDGFPAGALFEGLPVVVAEQGSAFGHAVAYGVGEADGAQEVFDFFVECRAADDDFLKFSS